MYLKFQSVPRSKHSISVIKASQLMLYREIIAVCSQIHTKHVSTLCGQNVELWTFNPRGIESDYWVLNDYTGCTFVHMLMKPERVKQSR
jgi:hypothetical protein